MGSEPKDGGTSQTGPIIFADETARTQLLEEGEVVTFRTSERTTGETWWRKSRTGEKEGDVTVELRAGYVPVSPHSSRLIEYRHLSGFDTVDEWVDAIYELNGDVERGLLYRVTEGHNHE